jgi:hypothetical protein
MKKLLIAFAIIAGLGVAAFATGSYLLYRAATPYIEDARSYVADARSYLRELSDLGRLEAEIKNTAPYLAPASGELTEVQVQRFKRVQEHVHTALGQRMREFEQKYERLTSDSGDSHPSVREVMGGLKELAGVFVQARRYQIDALNKEGFSQEEYSWVRNRVLAAAGIEFANRIDLRGLEQAIRDGTGIDDFKANFPKPDIPARNVELVKPHMRQFDDWIPLAFFGL